MAYGDDGGKGALYTEEGGADASDVDGTIDDGLARMARELEKMGIKIELRADGGRDSHVVFSFPAALGVIPVIKVRINSKADSGKSRPSQFWISWAEGAAAPTRI